MNLNEATVVAEVPGLYKIIPLNVFRRTPGVYFDNVPTDAIPKIGAIDRVVHLGNARSPGPVGEVSLPWYMHPHQEDNLIVLKGIRHVELYTRRHGKVEEFDVSAECIRQGDRVVFDGAALIAWPRAVFHRVRSNEEGSAAINFAVHLPGIDMRTNFNIYDVDLTTGKFRVIREAFLDQPDKDLSV